MTMAAPAVPPGIAALRRRGRLVLWIERTWLAVAPPLGLLGAYAALALLGLPARLGAAERAALLAATLAGAAWLALRRPARWRGPGAAEIDRRLERDSGLAHRPLAALADRPAGNDPASLVLWAAHRRRAEAALAGLRPPRPRPGRAAHDRFGLGGGLIVALAAALAIAGPRAPARLGAAFLPRLGGAEAPAARIAAWIAPPAYTGLAPIALAAARPALTVPGGSRLRLGVSGGSGRVRVRLGGRVLPLTALGRHGAQADAVLTQSGLLAVARGGRALGEWRITVVPASAPVLAWDAPPGPLAADPRETALPWRARDAYGLARLGVSLVPRDRPGAPARRVALTPPSPARSPPQAGGPGVTQRGVAIRDLTADPWAGLVVIARLLGSNGAGLAGTSPPAEFLLPERVFRDKLARAVIAIRRGLSLHPDHGAAAARALAALRDPPRGFGGDIGAWLELGLDIRRLAAPGAVAGVQQSLWRVAVGLEDRARGPADRALARARRAVRAALARARQDPSAANRAALDARIAALEHQIAAKLDRLAQALRRRGLSAAEAARIRAAIAHALGHMAERARADTAQNAMAAAAARLAALGRMLDRLDGAPEAIAQARQAMAALQAAEARLGALGAIMRREGRLLDHAHLRMGQVGELAAGGARMAAAHAAQRGADQAAQGALRRGLAALAGGQNGQPSGAGAAMGEAGHAMAAAEQALGSGQDGDAASAEQAALRALSQEGKSMREALARAAAAMGHGQGGGLGLSLSDLGLGEPRGGTGDPLGRGSADGPLDPAARIWIPAEQRLRRTQRIERVLRGREGEPDRPAEELHYIERLLRQF